MDVEALYVSLEIAVAGTSRRWGRNARASRQLSKKTSSTYQPCCWPCDRWYSWAASA